MISDNIIRESELILNPNGSVYHLKIKPENLAPNVILLGDPARVKMVSEYFDEMDFKGQNREFIIHTGTYRGKRITAMSTGMGTDNIDIVLNELDALVNIDLNNRTIKEGHRSLNLFRIGTSGSLQADLPLNAIVLSEFGLGFDGMLYFYDFLPHPILKEMRQAFINHTDWNSNFPNPYFFPASDKLQKLMKDEVDYQGITATAPGFYGPQGRKLRLALADPDLNQKLQSFQFSQSRILNYEMETSALYGLSHLLGHHAITICLAIANRKHRAVHQDHHGAMKALILKILNRILELEN